MHVQPSNQQVAQVFRDIADSMEVLGENRFKYQAYTRAAEVIDALATSLAEYVQSGTLQEIPGVGPAIAAKIEELYRTGRMRFRERLREQVPDGVLAILRVPGVGPKTALRLFRELGIDSPQALEAAAQAGSLRGLKGLGPKFEARVLASLATVQATPDSFLLGEMLPLGRAVLESLRRAFPAAAGLSLAGSLRRAAPTIGDLDLVAAGEAGALMDAFAGLPEVASVVERQERRLDVLLHSGRRCTLAVAAPETFGAVLAVWTGNQAHRGRLRERAAARGLQLSDRGLLRDDVVVPTPDEAAFWEALALQPIPPELREDGGEIEAAAAGTLPRLVELADMRADLHTHTTWSDGRASVLEMAEAGAARGYSYYAITDHSEYMGMVNGLNAARLRQQRAEIDAVNDELRRRGVELRLLQGIEVDILPDGSLALPDDALAALDWVVASPHVSLRQTREVFTERLLAAIRNPHVDCVGHPTGRRLLQRRGGDLDIERLIEAAVETGTVLEVDGAYERLDLDGEYVRQALQRGARIAIDSDAHGLNDLQNLEYGVLTARRGWARAEDVVNAGPWNTGTETQRRKDAKD